MLNSIISDNNYKIASMEILDIIKTDPNITQKNIDATIRKICKKYFNASYIINYLYIYFRIISLRNGFPNRLLICCFSSVFL